MITQTIQRAASFALTMAVVGAIAQDGPQKLPAIKLSVGMHAIQAEVAQTPDQRSTGLMFRKTMATNDGSITNIENMTPQTLDSHCSAKPVRFVLEMNVGWFAKRGIKAGTRIQGAPFAH